MFKNLLKMKKLFILSFLFAAISMSAQDSTQVVLSNEVARKVILELTEGDFCKKELEQTQKIVNQLEVQVDLQDTIIANKDKQQVLQEQIIKDRENELKQQKRKTTAGKILLYGSILLNGFLVYKLL